LCETGISDSVPFLYFWSMMCVLTVIKVGKVCFAPHIFPEMGENT